MWCTRLYVFPVCPSLFKLSWTQAKIWHLVFWYVTNKILKLLKFGVSEGMYFFILPHCLRMDSQTQPQLDLEWFLTFCVWYVTNAWPNLPISAFKDVRIPSFICSQSCSAGTRAMSDLCVLVCTKCSTETSWISGRECLLVFCFDNMFDLLMIARPWGQNLTCFICWTRAKV